MIQVMMWTDGIKEIFINVEKIKLCINQHGHRQRFSIANHSGSFWRRASTWSDRNATRWSHRQLSGHATISSTL